MSTRTGWRAASPRCARPPEERLAFLGVAVDSHRNGVMHTGPDHARPDQADRDITAAGATVRTMVITAREDLQIAREARQLLGAA